MTNRIVWIPEKEYDELIRIRDMVNESLDVFRRVIELEDKIEDVERELTQCQDCSGYCLYLKQEIKKLKEKDKDKLKLN